MERSIDEIWKKAVERFPTSTSAWLKRFENDVDRAKRAVKDYLKNVDAGKNLLRRHVDGGDTTGGVTESTGAIALLKLMAQQPQLSALLAAYANDRSSPVGNARDRAGHLLHAAAKYGCICDLRPIVDIEGDVDVLNNDAETALHLAAEYEHADDVELLLQLSAALRADKQGCTPLHSAALAISPNSTIARLLVRAAAERQDNFHLLNQLSNAESGRNTALHVAAGNVNVTAEFIEELRDTDPRLQNAELDTAFHVAAESSNPNVILYMLATFRPTNAGWDIDSVDENRGEKAPTLINMCAASGNAEAVALLIQHGADISQGVLHDVVIASVKKPNMVDKYLEVYAAVVDNVVTWRCLKDNRKCLIRGSTDYNEILRETMIYLTTKPFSDGNNVIQRAIDLGASEMLVAILNTENVYRFDEFGVRRHDTLRVMCCYSRFDVTNFAKLSSEPAEQGTTVEDPKDNNEDRNQELDFKRPFRPKTTYLEELLLHYDEWKNKSILAMQPFRKLTKPYFKFVQGYYFILGLIQLIFMICFSAYYIPDNCSLTGMFGSTNSHCDVAFESSSMGDDNNVTMSASVVTLQRESPLWLWLVWPVIILIGSALEFFIRSVWHTAVQLVRYARNSFTHDRSRLKVMRRLNASVWPTKLLLAAVHSFPLISFCISVFVWFHRHAHCDSRYLYLEALSMVFLFGWMVNFVLFSGVTEHLYVFSIVLNEIIVQDIILSFILVFVFTIIGFSFSLHALRLIMETSTAVPARTTVYDVFISALGIGEFFDETRVEFNNQLGLFRVVFAFYICFTAIILLNVLIAMMNSRYEDAKRRAESIWRYEVIQTAHTLEDFNIFKYLNVAKCSLFCRFFKELYEDVKKGGRTFIDVRLKVETDD